MKKIRIKARIVPQPCPYRATCSGACEWCQTHSYSEACVPMLQQEVRGHKVTLYCKYCNRVSFTETPFVVITQRGSRVEVQFHYCPHCGRKLEAE